MSNIKKFKSRKDVSEFLKTKNINTSNWTEKKWQSINSSQAEIHIQKIAEMMWDSYNESTPKELSSGEWHTPFGDKINTSKIGLEQDDGSWTMNMAKVKVSTARCARLSYVTHDGDIDYEKDIRLHDKLMNSNHWSPFEHCARAMSDDEYRTYIRGKCEVNPISEKVISPILNEGWCRNFRGWIPYRALIDNQ